MIYKIYNAFEQINKCTCACIPVYIWNIYVKCNHSTGYIYISINRYIVYKCIVDLIDCLKVYLIYLTQCLTNNRCSGNICHINQVFKSPVSSLITKSPHS